MLQKNEEENETLAAKWNKKTATKKCPISEEEKKTLIGIRLQKMLCKWKLVRKILLLHNIGNRANTILIDTHRLNP